MLESGRLPKLKCVDPIIGSRAEVLFSTSQDSTQFNTKVPLTFEFRLSGK